MKNIFFKIMAGAALVTAFASCELNDFPTFDEADSFVAIDKTTIMVNETAGQVVIPVTIASIDPMKTAVTYEIVDSTAKVNKHYKLNSNYESGVLSFDGTTRTQNIVVDIIDSTGVYTGDLVFTVNLLSGGKNLNLGASSTCVVKISDLDHPLADILGEYTVTGEDFAKGKFSYTMTLTKDDTDINTVWIDYVCPLAQGNPMAVYATVSPDHKTISIPCGQQTKAGLIFVEYTYDNGHYVGTSGSVDMVSTTPGVFTTEQGIGMIEGNSLYAGGVVLQGTTVWTKK